MGAITAPAKPNDATAVASEVTLAENQVAVEVLACSICDAPTLESIAIPRSRLDADLVYVIVCQDSGGREVVTEPFFLRRD